MPSRTIRVNKASRKRIYSKYGTFSTLLSIGTDPKTAKSNADGKHWTAILYLMPDAKLCPMASFGLSAHKSQCSASCLNTAGNPVYLAGKLACRKAKSAFFHAERTLFIECLKAEIADFSRKVKELGLIPAVRLNGTSDVVWEVLAPTLFTDNPYVTFYDYTKVLHRGRPTWKLPPNYSLTFSRSEVNHADILAMHAANPLANSAVVFSDCGISAHPKPFPATWNGIPVIDGDLSDLRFTDPRGVIVGLRAKGKAREDKSGFVTLANVG